MEISHHFSVRCVHGTSLTWRGVLGTPAVLAGVGTVVAAQSVFTYLPVLRTVFGTRPVALGDGLAIVETETRLAARLGMDGPGRGRAGAAGVA